MKSRPNLSLRWIRSLLFVLLGAVSTRADTVEIIDWAQHGGHTDYLLNASDWNEANSAATCSGSHPAEVESTSVNDFLQARFAPVMAANAPVNRDRSI